MATIKKLSIIFLFLTIFVPFSVFSAWFNTDPQDYPTLQVSNFTKNPNCSNCWSTTVNADPGDVISFLVYYHNNSNETAQNTRVRVSLPQKEFTSTNVLLDLWADNASVITGSSSINLSSPATLTYIENSLRWYPNQSQTPSPLLNNQDGSEIISPNGLLIGDIEPGWETQGYIVFRAQVSFKEQTQNQNIPPTLTTLNASSINSNSATLNASVNPNGSDTSLWFEYGASPSFGYTTNSVNVGSGNVDSNYSIYVSNLLPNTTYYFRAVAQNSYGTTYGNTLTFTTPQNVGVPYVSTQTASSIDQTSANLNAIVNPQGDYTTVWFEYGTSLSLGQISSSLEIGSGTNSKNVAISISNLLPNTNYYFRAVAQNSYGTTYGRILNFNTLPQQNQNLPIISTLSASSINSNSATLNASVNPNGSDTSLWFEYGASPSFGYTTNSVNVGSGNSVVNKSILISNLLPNTTYYFRAVAQNNYGVSYGNTLSFTTNPKPSNNSQLFPNVKTKPASVIYSKEAVIEAEINPRGYQTYAWFEWGKTSSLGNETYHQSVGLSNQTKKIASVLVQLKPNTTYYFRAVAQNQYGKNYGQILSFKTKSITTQNTPPQIKTTTKKTAQKIDQILIIPTLSKNELIQEEEFTYTLVYQNISQSKIKNIVSKIQLPEEVEFISSNIALDKKDNNLSFNIDLNPKSNKTIIVKLKTNKVKEEKEATIYQEANYINSEGNLVNLSTNTALTIKPQESASLTAMVSKAMNTIFGNWIFNLVMLILIIGLGYYVLFVLKQT